MKKPYLACLLLALAGTSNAEPVRLKSDGSALGEICVAALSSRAAMYSAAAAHGIDPLEPQTLLCNGLPVSRFVARYRERPEREEEAAAGYILNRADDSAVTALCVAAARSEQEYRRVKEQHFGADDTRLEAEVFCNGMPLRSFARKYRVPALAVSQR